MPKRVLLPVPDVDFDPTEVAVSWQVLTNHGHSVVFATESGSPATADDIMLTGRGLDIWSAVPLLGRPAFIGRFLRANRDARDAYAHMVQSPEYQHPSRWTAATIDDPRVYRMRMSLMFGIDLTVEEVAGLGLFESAPSS